MGGLGRRRGEREEKRRRKRTNDSLFPNNLVGR